MGDLDERQRREQEFERKQRELRERREQKQQGPRNEPTREDRGTGDGGAEANKDRRK